MSQTVSRLSNVIHALADKYLLTDEIRSTVVEDSLHIELKQDVSPFVQYGDNVRKIAQTAPLRIIPEEKLIGAATYRTAPRHACPGGCFSSFSHSTINFSKAIRLGLSGLETEIRSSMDAHSGDPEGLTTLHGLLDCIEAMRIWRDRYLEALETTQGSEAPRIRAILKRVPEYPAETFPQAVQSLWFFYEFQRLCGNWSGLGRLDKIWGEYYARDLAAGRIDINEAREYIAHFWIKGTEWKGIQIGSGDAQHYQNVILGGIDAEGNDVTNPITDLILDVVEELHISDFPIAVRVNSSTPDSMYRRIAEIQRFGGGIVSIYNEEIVIAAMEKAGYPKADAREFTNDGCWEVIVGGKTAFGYLPFDALQVFMEMFESTPCDSFDELFANREKAIRAKVHELALNAKESFKNDFDSQKAITSASSILFSLLVDDCIARARTYCNRGARYSIRALHAGGLPDVVNSMAAIRYFVFDTKKLTREQLLKILADDWKDAEELRKEARSLPCYGNNVDSVDDIMKKVFNSYTDAVHAENIPGGPLNPPGISTFGRELGYSEHRNAVPFGFHAHSVLAPNLSPTPGTDHAGAGSVVLSYCKNDFIRLTNGCPLDLKFHPTALAGENGIKCLAALLKTFQSLGGFYLQVDCADAATLRDAQAHPERYQNLSVRISGWSARFVTLNKDWQEMVIARTEQQGF